MDFLKRTWAEIDTKAIENNFNIIKSKTKNTKIMAVVKANAYGHGVNIVAPLLDRLGVDGFAVSNLDEAVELRSFGLKKPVLILGYTPETQVKALADYDITQAVFSKEFAEKLSEKAVKENAKIKIQIKLDTGMGRIGFDCRNDRLLGINDAIACAKLPNFDFTGAFTHFAVSDRNSMEEDGFTDAQYRRFIFGITILKSEGLNGTFHCCNSAALCIDAEKQLDMCRAGIILYGLTPSDTLDLGEPFIPVMTLKTVVSMVKTVDENQTISYGRTYRTKSPTKIATLAVGYADGYPRLLSNKGYVLIKGQKAPIVGRVCMDQMTVDITGIENVSAGDEAILFGKALPVEELSSVCGTINYETVCDITDRVPRIPV